MSARDSSHRYAGDFPCACLCEKDSSIPVEENLVSVKKVIAIVLKAVIDMQNILFLTFAVSCMAKVDGIYKNPLDLIEDLKKARLELKDNESAETPEQVNLFCYAMLIGS